MSKISVIIKREYLQAVRKKSFVVMTILGPIIFAALCIVPVLLSLYDNTSTTIAVADESGIFRHLDHATDKDIHYIYVHNELSQLKTDLLHKKYDAILYIPYDPISVGGMVYSHTGLNTGVMSNILADMKSNLTDAILISDFNIARDSLQRYINQHTDRISLGYTHIDKNGVEESRAGHLREIQMVTGLVAGLLIYIFIFMYCSTVYRGVLEEKTSRIVEIIVSSVKPIQLMTGKIIGVALIGLTQLALWIVFTGIILGIFTLCLPSNALGTTSPVIAHMNNMDMQALLAQAEWTPADIIMSINIPLLIGMFLFFFICGYFLYASLYAAVGAAADNDTDSQQFITVLTAPLLLSMILVTFTANHPDGPLAFWLSVIPFTSPIIMLTRIPAGPEVVPAWQILLSCSLLVLTCTLCIWLAAKIYRTGILMYGKKITYKELWKWLKYKD